MKIHTLKILTVVALATTALQSSAQRSKPFGGTIGKTLAESKEWWPEPTKAPACAPNIVWIILDDVGFGATSTFGGLISTPVFDSLANNGLRYTNFHTAGICAPTRSALLTGRNHHSVHMGGFAHTILSAGFPVTMVAFLPAKARLQKYLGRTAIIRLPLENGA